jgi:hypothetical protein
VTEQKKKLLNAWCELTSNGSTEGAPTGRIARSSPR